MEITLPKCTPDDIKFRELILYLAERSEGDKNFGATKLNKLLFYADFVYFLYHGRPITGHVYQKLEHGPAPRALKPVITAMEAAGEAKTVERQHYGMPQKRLVALRSANLEAFSAHEISFVESLIRDFWNKSAKDVSEQSHRFVGWKYADIGETIPYEVALVGHRRPTQEEIAYGLSLEDEGRERSARPIGAA